MKKASQGFRVLDLLRANRLGIIVVVLSTCLLTSCAMLGLVRTAEDFYKAGVDLFKRGQYREAIIQFEKAIQMDPNYGLAYLYLGRSYLNLGQWSDSISPLRDALRLSPDESKKQVVDVLMEALIGAASYELKMGNYQNAIGYLKDALQLLPQSEKAKQNLYGTLVEYGGKLLSQGNTQQAIGAFSEAIKLSPNDLNAYLGLAKSFLKNGDFLKALQVAEEALRLDPANKDIQSLFRELRK